MTVYDVAGSLPEAARLQDHCRAMAMIDAILEPEAAYRRHRYDAHWRPGAELAAMDNGAGDAYSIVFATGGVFIRGFDHESPMNRYDEGAIWPGVVEAVPAALAEYVTEPSFSIDGDGILTATCCLWRQTGDSQWRAGQVQFPEDGDDGADYLLGMLTDRTPEQYQQWACEYFGSAVDVAAVQRIFAMQPLTDELVAKLNAQRSLADLTSDIDQIEYPS